MFYLTTHSTHFIYGYMASDIWLRTILIVRKETRCRHIGYSYRLTARVLLYAPSHRQDNTYHGLCYTSRGALAGTRNSSMGGYMASNIWLRTIPIVRKETRCRHMGYSYRLTARVLLYAPSHRQDNTYHGLCYTSRGALAGTRNSSMGGYMASNIWLRTIPIVRKETRCRHIGYSYRLTARVLLYAPSHRQDNTYHGLCYTSRGALAGTRNSSMGGYMASNIWLRTIPIVRKETRCRHIGYSYRLNSNYLSWAESRTVG